MKKSVNKYLILAVIIALIVVAAIIFNQFTGFVVSDKKEADASPRHIFYESPRVASNQDYLKTCYPAQEVMEVLPNAKCCAGLDQLTIYDESTGDCSRPLTGEALCSNCGNKKCEYGENKCNCPDDCKK